MKAMGDAICELQQSIVGERKNPKAQNGDADIWTAC
jgi:hypothetical protein